MDEIKEMDNVQIGVLIEKKPSKKNTDVTQTEVETNNHETKRNTKFINPSKHQIFVENIFSAVD